MCFNLFLCWFIQAHDIVSTDTWAGLQLQRFSGHVKTVLTPVEPVPLFRTDHPQANQSRLEQNRNTKGKGSGMNASCLSRELPAASGRFEDTTRIFSKSAWGAHSTP